jgi:hypothetical protein
MNARDHQYYRELIGAYVSGQIESSERRDLLGHLDGCEACQRELSELQDIVLQLSESNVLQYSPEPPARLEENVVSATLSEEETRGVRHGSRSRRTIVGAAVAAVLVVAVGLATVTLQTGGSGEPGLGDVEPISFTAKPEKVTVDGAVVAHTWGTEIMLEAEGLSDGEVYTVAIEGEKGDETSAGTFVGDSDVPVNCQLNGAVLRQDAEEILVRNSESDLILRSNLSELEA